MQQALTAIESLNENYGIKQLIDFITGNRTKEMVDFKHDKLPLFGVGKEKDNNF